MTNLLQNPSFEFHAFENHRLGRAVSYTSGNVAFWNCSAWGDITVTREAHVDPAIRPAFSTGNLVTIQPGKAFWQFFTLPEAGLAHGEKISLFVYGNQAEANALQARIKLLKIDSEDGTWCPKADFKMSDDRTFPRHARGELVVAKQYEVASDTTGAVELRIDGAEIVGKFHTDADSHSDDINTIAIQVEFANTGKKPVWIWSPCLSRAATAQARLPAGREMVPMYRYLPRTLQKLWKGEAVHIILMGSSIDRGSANPPMYLYDEDPASATFKQPLSDRVFEPERVGRKDLDGYVGWWQHYFNYAGRLRLELLRKFNLPVNKICLNVMACDGSCVGEAHSGLAAYCSLALPPEENTNGHEKGKTWQELYPDLFARPEGPRPDLVIFGSGANEKTDTPDEVAVFEGMIRWFQRHYPQTEFVFSQFQNAGGYTPNPGDLQALGLRYRIPFLDYGKVGDDLTRWCSRQAFVPKDGHPQAVSHFVWFKALEKAFECWDPVMPGQVQVQLPERLHVNSYGWEGDMVTYDEKSGRIKGGMFVFDDTVINCWADSEDGKLVPYIDGQKQDSRGKSPGRDVRNSAFRFGRCRIGDRHMLELEGKSARLTFVDAKVCPERRFVGIDSPQWVFADKAEVAEFKSEFGAPYGAKQVVLPPGKAAEIEVIGTDVSIAYVDAKDGGKLRLLVGGVERLVQPVNLPFVAIDKTEWFMENRKGILGLGFGVHTVRVEAVDAPVTLLGVFVYDSRPNRANERRLFGRAAPGETVSFSLPFKARPVVICHDGLAVKPGDVACDKATFSGQTAGTYEVVGE
ncbi:MAG: hypothetical protein A3K19_06215 [Lentisphaerae bacterium RIFOXYB12_FULL_65_16]|nr:MAG: hypothetical protein A3K18_14345 [Lentisphaerae bacterium RIFOXYA12_64_32]OGV90225.1 MAG: hypothetical protein A3K19_06215 [Lentisphaerae bacterium RIFOXYB12_FULL_65_16]